MYRRFPDIIVKLLRIMEIILAGLLTIAIGVFTIQVIISAIPIIQSPDGFNEFQSLLSNVFSLIIGVEFVKMICKPTMGNVVEVLLFAVARFVIIDHSTITTSLLGVLSIAILFAIKKYLLQEDTAETHKSAEEKPRTSARIIRSLYGLRDTSQEDVDLEA